MDSELETIEKILHQLDELADYQSAVRVLDYCRHRIAAEEHHRTEEASNRAMGMGQLVGSSPNAPSPASFVGRIHS